jgi:hypothetical protein
VCLGQSDGVRKFAHTLTAEKPRPTRATAAPSFPGTACLVLLTTAATWATSPRLILGWDTKPAASVYRSTSAKAKNAPPEARAATDMAMLTATAKGTRVRTFSEERRMVPLAPPASPMSPSPTPYLDGHQCFLLV